MLKNVQQTLHRIDKSEGDHALRPGSIFLTGCSPGERTRSLDHRARFCRAAARAVPPDRWRTI